MKSALERFEGQLVEASRRLSCGEALTPAATRVARTRRRAVRFRVGGVAIVACGAAVVILGLTGGFSVNGPGRSRLRTQRSCGVPLPHSRPGRS